MSKRRLYHWETALSQAIFGNQIDYARVWIHEDVWLPNGVDNVGRTLRRMPRRPAEKGNAIAIGNRCIFPNKLPTKPLSSNHPDAFMHGWLVHELTHVWQFQQIGWRYIRLALNVQFEDGIKTYHYGGPYGLNRARQLGWRLQDYDLEKQATIVQHYYDLYNQNRDTSVYQPFIDDITSCQELCDSYVEKAASSIPEGLL